MIKPRLIRSLVAIATIATLLSTTYRSSAAELHGLVVTGVALDRVASQHSMPPYPLDARSQRIQAEVRVRIQVKNGKMVHVTSESKSPILGKYASQTSTNHPTVFQASPRSFRLVAGVGLERVRWSHPFLLPRADRISNRRRERWAFLPFLEQLRRGLTERDARPIQWGLATALKACLFLYEPPRGSQLGYEDLSRARHRHRCGPERYILFSQRLSGDLPIHADDRLRLQGQCRDRGTTGGART
jgi:hypothetical protein